TSKSSSSGKSKAKTSTKQTGNKENQSSNSQDQQASEDNYSAQLLPPASGPAYPVDGMIGQVNGQAIYADAVLKPISAQLKALSKRVSPSEFIKRAKQLIENRLRQIVADNLILGQAMRDLDSNQKKALNHYVQM